MRVLGIDPGIAIVGYSILDVEGDCCTLVSSGSIQTDKNKTEAGRLYEISRDLEEIIKQFSPDTAGVEKLYFFKNQKTIIPATKDEVAGAVERMVEKNDKNWPKLDDTVDSIAIAVCHARNLQCDLSKYVSA